MTDEYIDRGPLTYPVELDRDTDEGPGLLASNALWLGGSLLAVACWTLIWLGLAWLFDYLYTFN